MGGKILPNRHALSSEQILARVAKALLDAKTNSDMTTQALAEALGKEDRKSASGYLAGESDMGLVAFIRAVNHPALGDEFANKVLGPLTARNVCTVDGAPAESMDALAIGVSAFLNAFLQFYANRHLDHQETLALARLLRPMMPHFHAIIAEADRIAA